MSLSERRQRKAKAGRLRAMKRQTSQRRAILTALEEAPGPLTPQEVLEHASKLQAGLGLATVYRNLNTLEAHGMISQVHLPGETTRYELAGRGHHHHFRCQRCEGVFELDAKCPVAILEGVTLPGGFVVKDHELTLYGLCPTCQQAS
jgi:Fur family ferric uptake transcriptional regulator